MLIEDSFRYSSGVVVPLFVSFFLCVGKKQTQDDRFKLLCSRYLVSVDRRYLPPLAPSHLASIHVADPQETLGTLVSLYV